MKASLTLATAVAGLLFAAGAASAEDLTFTLINGTNSTLTEFYTSPTDVENWEQDVFGKGVLPPGHQVEITIADGRTVCDYDMRFVFDEDSDLDVTEDTQNLCEMGSYTIHE